jgi:ankyrin repeat protein
VRHSIQFVEAGQTHLHRAIRDNASLESILETIRSDPKAIHIIDRNLGRPIDLAAYKGRIDVIKALLDHGASPNGLMQGGSTPGKYTLLQDAALLGKVDLVKLLLAHGADPTAVSTDGETALDIARKYGHDEIVDLLRDAPTNNGREKPADASTGTTQDAAYSSSPGD